MSILNSAPVLKATPLSRFHKRLGGHLGAFAGWELPLVYDKVTSVESHLFTRQNASWFDVSHMRQRRIFGRDKEEFLSYLCPADIQGLGVGHNALSFFMNKSGGMVDDLILGKHPTFIHMVTNAGQAVAVEKHLKKELDEFRKKKGAADVHIEYCENAILLAIQGPKSEAVVSDILGNSIDLKKLHFMECIPFRKTGILTRCGYTGEDGFEISIPKNCVEEVCNKLVQSRLVKPAGLLARDSLRLEAGLNLYGHEGSETTSPLEVGLSWTVPKIRKRNFDFVGGDILRKLLASGGPPRIKRGIQMTKKSRIPMPGSKIFSSNLKDEIGVVTSSGFSPSTNSKIGIAILDKNITEKSGQNLRQIHCFKCPKFSACVPNS
eukprot:GHVP01065005.1.p1 GENE.GHVP01065005.1~~GHVP01065005.1.p1  ORF type:complete len:378 (-),score=64.24 GHVP01065005.1:1113-2246(-)